jgi:hypothetical protein
MNQELCLKRGRGGPVKLLQPARDPERYEPPGSDTPCGRCRREPRFDSVEVVNL